MKKKYAFYTVITGIFFFLIYVLIPLPNEQLKRDYSQVIMAKDSTFLRVFLNNDEQWCLPPQLQSNVPKKLKTAILSYEDQYFYRHLGINPISIIRAIYLNIKHDKIISGGSTITMQVARMIRNKPRTISNKLIEILLACKIELNYSKDEILNDYLSHAPYGSNIRGYIAASYRFFGKKPDELTWGEAATLAVLPNAPGMVFPSKNDDKLKVKRNKLLFKLFEKEVIDQETYELSLLERTPSEVIPFPLAAPHLTEKIHSENQLSIVLTTIDAHLQYETNFFVKQHALQMKQLGISNVSALIVNNYTSQVVSYVGSQDFDDLNSQGRVDGIISKRSSGSILKPFLYALAIDEGLILPQTLIKDVPTYFNSYAPSNASENFSGIVPASKALVNSLNIPAVRLLNSFGVHKFYNLLQAAGVQSLFRNADEYGLPLILGGAEVTPWDMAKLYLGMAKGGQFNDISYLNSQSKNQSRKLLNKPSSFMILNELSELIRPGLEFYWKKYNSQKQIAWKTGTSYGHKDAWAVGVTPQWTIVVWVGNFDGTTNKNLSGMKSAGPLLFNIHNTLPESSVDKWFEIEPEELITVKICQETGFYATENCNNSKEMEVPANMKALKVCPFHQKIFIEEHTQYEVCSHCWSGKQIPKSILKFTPDINYYLRKNGAISQAIHTHKPTCPIRQEKNTLSIIYPLNNANVFIPKDFNGRYQSLISRVATQYPKREIFWYLDESFLGSTIEKPSFPLKLKSGKHTLTTIDTEGNNDKVTFYAILN